MGPRYRLKNGAREGGEDFLACQTVSLGAQEEGEGGLDWRTRVQRSGPLAMYTLMITRSVLTLR